MLTRPSHLMWFLAGAGASLLGVSLLAAKQRATQPTSGTEPASTTFAVSAEAPDDGKLRIICFGGHPDELRLARGRPALDAVSRRPLTDKGPPMGWSHQHGLR